jgi:hypothetical protein
VARFPAKSHDQARKGHTPSRLLKKNSGVSPRHSRTERNASDETDAPSPSRAKSFRPFRFRELVKLPLRKRGEQSAVRRESTRARAFQLACIAGRSIIVQVVDDDISSLLLGPVVSTSR